ncbi:MAG: efflux RND transporter periplasmic adaptor subunit, partial [Planctomycetia bacterium]
KKFGGEVHEMGFLLLVFTPALYCNVTDAWMLPNKWHRVVIGAAGIYIELILSGIFFWIWWNTEPGLLNTLSLSIVFVCSVSTVFFNGNPLLRFDGYYILSDFLEIPNLRERSNTYLGNVAGKCFLGTEVNPDPYLPKRNRWFFAAYAVTAYLYRWVVTFGILLFMYTFLKPYKLAMISKILAVASLIPLAVLPVYQMQKNLRNRWRGLKVNKTRMATSIPLAVAVVALVLFMPLPMWIDVPMMLQVRDGHTVYVPQQGILQELNVVDRDRVGSGTLLARLYDPKMSKELEELLLEYRQNQDAAKAYQSQRDFARAQQMTQLASAKYQEINLLREHMAKLDVTVPSGVQGDVFTPPKKKELGKTLKAGDRFCEIGDIKNLQAYLVVENTQMSLVGIGQTAWIKLYGHVGPIIESRITQISSTPIADLPQALSNKAGGEVQTETDEQAQQEVPMFKSFAVQVPIENLDGTMTPNVRGIARIDIGWKSIFWRAKRYIQQTLNFRM